MDEPTQPMAEPPRAAGEVSFSGTKNDALVVLIGSVGISCTWELLPDKPGLAWTFGRGTKADFKFPSNRTRLSSIHFKIWATQDDPPTIMMQDVSTNGTCLNSVRVPKGRNCMLMNGDMITVGQGVAADELKLVVSIPMSSKARPQGGIYESYEFGELVGQGAFALVRQAVKRDTGEKVAVKIIDRTKITGNLHTAVEREIEILKALRHPNIVALHNIFMDEKHYYLVMDWVPHGDLMDHLLNAGNPGIPEDTSRAIVRQVLEAIRYVHSMGISHRDLKPDNILINTLDPVSVKVADFGLAKLSNQGTFLKTFCGTLSYLAPEVLASRGGTAASQRTAVYTQLVDIWSVGCLAYVILTGCMPFGGGTQEELYSSVMHGDYYKQPLDAANVSQEARRFLDTLLMVDTARRPQAAEALELPWLSGRSSETLPPNETNGSAAQNELAAEHAVNAMPSRLSSEAPAREQHSPSAGHSFLDDGKLPSRLPSRLPSHLPSQMPSQMPSMIGPDSGPDSDSAPDPALQSSFPEAAAPHTSIQGLDDLRLQSSRPRLSRAPSSRDDEDSDEDSEDTKKRIDRELSQQAQFSQSVEIRDFGDAHVLEEGDGPLPNGVWAVLQTLPNSEPCKDLCATSDTFSIGRFERHRNTPSPAVDYMHDDKRLSRLHCKLERVRDEQNDKYVVWLLSNNDSMYVNGLNVAKGQRAKVYDGDRITLFAEQVKKDNKVGFDVLAFSLQLIGEADFAAFRRPPKERKLVLEAVEPVYTNNGRGAEHNAEQAARKRDRSADLMPQPKRQHTVLR